MEDLSKFDIIIKDEGTYFKMTFQSEKALKVIKKKPDIKRNVQTDDETNKKYLILDSEYLYPMKNFCKVNNLKLFEF